MVLVANVLAGAVASTARPAATLLGVQLLVRWGVHAGHLVAPSGVAWAVADLAIAAAAALAVVEHLVQREGSFARIARQAHLERVLAAAGTLATSLLFASLGVPNDDVVTEAATGQGHAAWADALLVGVALTLNVGLGALRSAFLERLEDVDLDDAWRRLEGGGVLAVLIVMALAPLLALVLTGMAVVAVAALGALASAWIRARDRAARRPCPGCGHAVRVEARVCPACRVEVPVVRTLGAT